MYTVTWIHRLAGYWFPLLFLKAMTAQRHQSHNQLTWQTENFFQNNWGETWKKTEIRKAISWIAWKQSGIAYTQPLGGGVEISVWIVWGINVASEKNVGDESWVVIKGSKDISQSPANGLKETLLPVLPASWWSRFFLNHVKSEVSRSSFTHRNLMSLPSLSLLITS